MNNLLEEAAKLLAANTKLNVIITVHFATNSFVHEVLVIVVTVKQTEHNELISVTGRMLASIIHDKPEEYPACESITHLMEYISS